MYWAQYYITPGRLKKSLFTSPVISDVGISMVMKPPVKGMWDKSFELIIVPFTGTVRLEQLIIPWPELRCLLPRNLSVQMPTSSLQPAPDVGPFVYDNFSRRDGDVVC